VPTPEIGRPLPDELLDCEVIDASRRRSRLREHLGERPALLVFLRHFGCVGCSQQVDALVPRVADIVASGADVVLVGNGEPEHIEGFVERQRLAGHPVTILTDPTLKAHRAAGFDRSAWMTIGPAALWSDLMAFGRGYFSAGTQGDRWQQGGILVVDAAGTLAFRAASRSAPDPVAAETIVDAVFKNVVRHARAEGKDFA
jgi:peroxiredoxin